MSRLLVHVEGEAEETFVNEMLADHLYSRGFTLVGARLIGNARQRTRRGGIRSWPPVRRDIVNHLRGDPGCLATTMVDFYAMPTDWPGREAANSLPFHDKAGCVEDALLADIRRGMGDTSSSNRFIPFALMHEFEGLLFSDCESFARGIGKTSLQRQFQAIRNQFESPEEINDSPATAPSKRIEDLFPRYEKPLMGTLAALEIGLEKIRSECPHFSDWLQRLESRALNVR